MTRIMYDSVTVDEIPDDAPAVAGYVDGNWPTFASLGQFKGNRLSIAVSASADAECLDCEPGDVPGAEAGPWARGQLAKGRYRPVLYSSRDNMPGVLASLAGAGVKRTQVRLWSAHYGIGAHICSPVSCGANFTADGTQWTDRALDRNLDESLLVDGFFKPQPNHHKPVVFVGGAPAPVPTPPAAVVIHPKVKAAGLAGAVATAIQAVLHARHLTITPAEASAVTAAAATLAGYFTPSHRKST